MRTVPVVIYEGGERKVIGEATVYEDATGIIIDAEIGDDFVEKFGFTLKQVSLGSVKNRTEQSARISPFHRSANKRDKDRGNSSG